MSVRYVRVSAPTVRKGSERLHREGIMIASQARARALWNTRVLGDMLASSATQAVVFTDTNGRVIHSEFRREMPAGLVETMDCVLSAKSVVGERLGLGDLRIGASLHDGGTVVWGRGEHHAVVVVATGKSNLGQLISQVRRVFTEEPEA